MVRICFAAARDRDEDRAVARPSDEQVAAYSNFLAHDAAIAKVVLARILREYPTLRQAYHDDYGIDPEAEADDDDVLGDLKPLPVIRRSADLREVMGLATNHVLDVAKGGVAYVGFELGCDWDDEHGAGVMLHKQRIVELGGADTSFLAWIAERDGGKRSG